MFVDRLYLLNFRNYLRQEFVFDGKINIFEGANGEGKTNLLEAIYYLAVSRSFRTNNDLELINWKGTGFLLKGVLEKTINRYTVETIYQGTNKSSQVKVNGSIVKRGDFIFHFPVVVFSPDDLFLIKEGPSVRRRFLNLEGSRLKPAYYYTLKDYHRTLQQRNKLLKECRPGLFNNDLFEPWDSTLVALGSSIIQQRISFLRELEEKAKFFSQLLSDNSETLAFYYSSSVDFKGDLLTIEKYFREQLLKSRKDEINRGYTLTGPHLDDFMIMVNNQDARKYASQGQQRTAALALKMGEVELFFLSNGEVPVILLDDVFSELDPGRRNQLLQFLITRKGQSFITTAVPFDHYIFSKEDYKIFQIHKGKINGEGVRSNH